MIIKDIQYYMCECVFILFYASVVVEFIDGLWEFHYHDSSNALMAMLFPSPKFISSTKMVMSWLQLKQLEKRGSNGFRARQMLFDIFFWGF